MAAAHCRKPDNSGFEQLKILKGPQRIVCLTEETTETLYMLGQQDRIVGISGFTVRPPEARRDKPRVAAFTSAKIDRILELKPDLVLGFSDLQADIAADLIRAGIAVHVFNQRSIDGILEMIRTLGALVNSVEAAKRLIGHLTAHLHSVKNNARRHPKRPRIYFEEWNEPPITAIQWVSELIELAGGEDCFAERAKRQDAKGRIIEDAARIIEQKPDIIIGSWCGKRFRPERVIERPGWQQIPAVRDGQLHEIKSCDILQPGPAALTDGLDQIVGIIDGWIEMKC